jgi:hypothetical protein
VNYILLKRPVLDAAQIQKIVEWLRRRPHISNFKAFKGFRLPFRIKW